MAHQPIRRDPITEGRLAILSLRRQLEGAQFLADRMMGRAPQVVVGERVQLKSEARKLASLPDVLFTITEVVGKGADAMTKLKAPDGRVHQWFNATELALPSERRDATQDDADTQLLTLANQIVAESHGKILLSDAVKEAGRRRPELVQARDEESVGSAVGTPEARESAATLEAAGRTLMELANTIVKEEGVTLHVAMRKAQRMDPTSAERYFTLMTGR